MIRSRTTRRNTAVRPPREVAARFAFALYVLAIPAGLLALAWGTAHANPSLQIAGGASFALAAGLHVFARRPLDFSEIVQELKRNPFKAEPRECTTSEPAAQTDAHCRSCGSL
jgi:hypothetical protein